MRRMTVAFVDSVFWHSVRLVLVSSRCPAYHLYHPFERMHFSQSVSIIQSQVGVIRGVQVLYSDTNPLDVDLVINLPHDGIRLIFDPVVQRLKIIEIYNMKLVKLKYCGLPFNSPEVLPSIEQIEHSFGATHPGVYDSEKQVFVLNFRGLSFYFPIDSKFQPGYAHGLGSLQFPNGTSPLVAKTAIYVGNMPAGGSSEEHGSKTPPPPLPLVCYHNNLYLEKADIIRDKARTRGLRLHLFTEGSSGSRALLEPKKRCLTKEVLFGDTCEDVLSALGAPSRVFYKAEDKMRIHSPHAHKRDKTRRSDFFYNYFTLGLDILFNAKTQCIKKFVLHTNYPGHYNFNMYHRCEFSLTLPPENNSTESGKLIDVSPSPVTITAYTKWDRVSEQLKASARPVVLNRASSTNTTNPFGCTFCYGIRDAIVEVMANQHIASVTLYKTA